MAQITTPDKVIGDQFSHTDYNEFRKAINSKSDGARRAFPVTGISTGYDVNHGFGAMLGKTASQYYLEVRAYDADGELVGGVTITKTTADVGTVAIAGGATLTGTLVVDVSLY